MKNKLILSLMLVLVLSVSCKNNTTDSTTDEDKNATLTIETLNAEINSMTDQSPVISVTETSTTKSVTFPINYAFNDYSLTDYKLDVYVTPNSLKGGLDKAFAGIQNGKINYEVTPPNITSQGRSTQIITITLTPKNSSDTFNKSSFRNSGKKFYKTIESNKIVCEFEFDTNWKPN
ncbi:hypothetical protein BFL38_08985 [Brachyspira hampsonii]|uniref:Lipoprotein n=1 Tax=Brachyspira hampsonii TaxID=1287055 RepID=A0A1E5NFM3_9SPIR|nr:hypothetical protein [Brachyspira hampsonii]OEJ14955.1 hypothetical protein BFL38_08985 [Brachyspira hampsonii]